MSATGSWELSRPPDRSVSLSIDAAVLRVIRQRVRQLVGGRTGVLVDDAVQVTDELVSNAYRHGKPPRTVRLTLLHGGRRLRIEVDDTGPAQPVIRNRDGTGGLGLVLVERLAASWGVQRYADHKTVWAEVDLADSSRHHPRVRHLTTVSVTAVDRPPTAQPG